MSRIYQSVSLIKAQQEFLKILDDNEIVLFKNSGIETLLGEKIRDLDSILVNLTNKGFLIRLERGKYCRATFHNEFSIGCFLAPDGAIAYWSALNAHGLTEQFPNKIFVQTTRVKRQKIFRGTTYDFITVPTSKRTGIVRMGHGNNSFLITDPEKTLIDCFDQTVYSGGFAELLKAFAGAKLSSVKMIGYNKAVHNIAALKRMGFLADLLGKDDLKSFIRYAKSEINNSYDLFDPNGERTGIPNGNWRLRMNITPEQILNICQSEQK